MSIRTCLQCCTTHPHGDRYGPGEGSPCPKCGSELTPHPDLETLGIIYLYEYFSQDVYSARWMGGLEDRDRNENGRTMAARFQEWLERGGHLGPLGQKSHRMEDAPLARKAWNDYRRKLGYDDNGEGGELI